MGAAWTLYQLSKLNLQAGYWDIFWPQFVQGAALALLFVPLTTVTMDPIPQEEMGNATSLFNLMRNLGGSIGIAAATTFLFRRQQFHTQRLGEHVSMLNSQTQAFFRNSQSAMMRHGGDPAAAAHAVLCRALGHGAAAGVDARLRGHVPGDGDRVSAGAAVPVHHETAEAPSGRRSDALGARVRAPLAGYNRSTSAAALRAG